MDVVALVHEETGHLVGRNDLSESDDHRPAVIEAILNRRSVREGFSDRAIADDVLGEIVLCGMAAPSSKNARPWRMHVVSNASVLKGLADAVASAPDIEDYVPHDSLTGRPRREWVSTVIESADVLRQAAAAIFVENRGVFGSGRDALGATTPENFRSSIVGHTLEIIGIGAAIQNMWIAANALGVQAAFMGDVVIAEATIRSALDFDGDLIGVLALAYSDTAPLPRIPDLNALSDPRYVRRHITGTKADDNG